MGRIFQAIVYLFELAFHTVTVIVEYIIHSGIPNYTKLTFNSLTMIQNDQFLSVNQTGDGWPLMSSCFVISHAAVRIDNYVIDELNLLKRMTCLCHFENSILE